MLRRHFLLSSLAATAATTAPDTILFNGVIYAAPEGARFRKVQALAVANGRILASGDNREIQALATASTKRIDLAGRTALPGFIDSHSHVASSGLRHLREVDCDLRSIALIAQAIRERAAKTAKGEWVIGFKYDDTKTAEQRKLNRADLDSAAPSNPVLIIHRGGHTGFANSAALQQMDLNDKSPDPAGGAIVRDAQGRLTGELLETAVRPPASLNRPATASERREGVALITRMFARAGITSTTDAFGQPEDLRAYQDAHENRELFCRVYSHIGFRAIDRMISAGIRTGFGNEWFRVGAMKLVADGSISERTARLSRPYEGRPNDHGIVVMPENELYEHARKAHLAGWQIGTHANGDVGIDIALKVYERLQREHPARDPRFRLEHCTLINDDLLRRIQSLNAIPTPFWTYVYYHGEKMKHYGAGRLNRMFAMRSFLDHGIRVAPGSDYVPGPFEPMMALQSCVTRTDVKGVTWGPGQKITVAEAVRASTANGAYATFEENLKGALEPGKLADLVVLGRDPFTADPSTLASIPVERTMAGGRWVHES
ncbi:MAG TPA: amidohydrolase [Bryobacteraceae bacterium]|nr:amidohydrolase [Bryobacteraceae bacterium]